jgi:hypothetical protein
MEGSGSIPLTNGSDPGGQKIYGSGTLAKSIRNRARSSTLTLGVFRYDMIGTDVESLLLPIIILCAFVEHRRDSNWCEGGGDGHAHHWDVHTVRIPGEIPGIQLVFQRDQPVSWIQIRMDPHWFGSPGSILGMRIRIQEHWNWPFNFQKGLCVFVGMFLTCRLL